MIIKFGLTNKKKGQLVGNFTPDGPEDYVGAIPAIRAVLYFKEGYSDEMRKAIIECFDDYQVYAKDYLTWLWQDEPPKKVKKPHQPIKMQSHYWIF